jgi:hypothetical protein
MFKIELTDIEYINKFEFITLNTLNASFKEELDLNFESSLFFFKDLSNDNFKNSKLS